MESIASLPFASLLFCLLTLQCSEAFWSPLEETNGKVMEWIDAQQYDVEVMEAFQFYMVDSKLSTTPPGRYQCLPGEEYLIMSENHPEDYPRSQRLRWIFKTDSDTLIKFHCPTIRIPPSPRCKNDKLIIFTGKKFRRGVRRCGRINNLRWQTYDNLKISFKSNKDYSTSKGFMCTIYCEGLPTTTTTTSSTTTQTSTSTSSSTTTMTTTTTYSPLCPDPAFPPAVPTPVASCSDIPPEFSSICSCTDCSGKMSLTCNFCTRCDFDLFALLDFSLDITLEPHFHCTSESMDISGFFFHNADNIVALRMCLDEDMSHITFPFSEITSINTLAYQDCNDALIDICTNSRRKRSTSRSLMTPTARTTYGFTLPDAADIPSVVNLYLYDVNVTLDNTILGCPNLQELSIDSDDVELSANAFSNLVNLEMLSVRMCQTEIVSEEFKLTTTYLESLTIDDTCVHTIANDAIVLDSIGSGRQLRSTGTGMITITITASSTLYQYIPMCPFRALLELDCVEVIWNTEVLCRNCGGGWAWDLTDSEIGNITATCYDAVSNTSMSLSTYIDNNSNPCGFSIPYTGC